MELGARALESLVMTPGFWSGKRVFLTGHTGFKGSWLSLWLQELGASVVGYALPPPTEPSLFAIARVGDRMVSLTGDVRDLDGLVAALARHRPEIVVHLAAQTLVRQSYADPVGTYAINVMGTVNILEAARRCPDVRVALIVSSDKCYQNREWVWGYREDEPMGGHDPYSSSKGCVELVAAAFRDSFFPPTAHARGGVAVATARAGNVIGGGDWAIDRLVPDVMRAWLERRPAVVRRPEARRPWQHVLEPLRGYLTLVERLWEEGPRFAQAWNFGPVDEDAQPVAWIVRRLAELWGDDMRWDLDRRAHPHEAGYLKLDSSKARMELGWTPKLALDEGLQWVVEWYRSYRTAVDIRALSLEQIARYQRRLGEGRPGAV